MEAALHAAPPAATPGLPNRQNLRRNEASAYLLEKHGLSFQPQSLANLASRGGGPRFRKAGKTPLYPRDELDRWAEARLGDLKGSTSE